MAVAEAAEVAGAEMVAMAVMDWALPSICSARPKNKKINDYYDIIIEQWFSTLLNSQGHYCQRRHLKIFQLLLI